MPEGDAGAVLPEKRRVVVDVAHDLARFVDGHCGGRLVRGHVGRKVDDRTVVPQHRMKSRWRRCARGIADNLAGFVETGGRGRRAASQRTEVGLGAVLPEERPVATRDAHHLAEVVHVYGLRALDTAERAEVCEVVRRRSAPKLVGSERGKEDQRERGESSECPD